MRSIGHASGFSMLGVLFLPGGCGLQEAEILCQVFVTIAMIEHQGLAVGVFFAIYQLLSIPIQMKHKGIILDGSIERVGVHQAYDHAIGDQILEDPVFVEIHLSHG